MKHFTIYLILTIMLGLTCCTKETIVQPKDYTYVITKDVTSIDSSGATLEADILYSGKDEITDFGFRLNDSYEYSLKNKGSLDDFKLRISTDLQNGITYRCRAYVETNKNLVLGNEVSFISLGSKLPIIEDFNPKEGFDGTLVTLKGKYFSQSANNKVFINNSPAEVLYSSEDSIVFITPQTNFTGDAIISIKANTKEISSNAKFKILGPEIESISSLVGHSGDSVTIKGKNFIKNGNGIAVFFGNYNTELVSFSDTLLKVIVPIPLLSLLSDQSVAIKVISGAKTITNRNYFFLIQKSWESKRATPFNSNWKYQAVTFDGKGYILEELTYKVLYEYSPVSDQWSTVSSSNFPGDMYESSLFIVSADKLFKIGGYNYLKEPMDELWEFSFTEKKWLQKHNIPFNLFNGTFFNLNNQLYIVTSEGQLWKCNLENEQYVRLNNFPDTFKFSFASSFISNGKAFVVNYGHTWQYNEASDNWIEKSTNPFLNAGSGFSLNGTGYVLDGGEKLYRYDFVKDKWNMISKYPGCLENLPVKVPFVIEEKAYLALTSGHNWGCPFEMFSFNE